MNQKHNTKYDLFFIFFFVLIILFDFLQNIINVSFVSYFDEIIALFGGILLIKDVLTKKLKKSFFLILFIAFLFYLIEFYVSFSNSYQTISYILIDSFTIVKFFLSIYLFISIGKTGVFERNKNKIVQISHIFTYLLFAFTIIFYLTDFLPSTDIRYGVKCLKLFSSTYSSFASLCIFLLIILFSFDKTKYKFINCILLSLMIILTFRNKAIAFLILIWAFYLLKKINSKILKPVILIFSVFLIFYFCFDQFLFYFVKIDNSARNELLKKSFIIANENFFGTGFGSFGSASSGYSYSNVYYKYGLNNIYGLSPSTRMYISDNFWPMILGQFGYIGFILYIALLVYICLKIKFVQVYEYKFAAFLSIIYLLINSLAESAFVHPTSLYFAFIIGLSLSYSSKIFNKQNSLIN